MSAASTTCWPRVGIFSLLVGATVRTRRPNDQATLHFFWLSVAFFGVFTFSFSGRLDRVDWMFYWADQVATLLLPPLFVHFALVFPERPRDRALARAGRSRAGRCSTLPPAASALARASALVRASEDPAGLIGTIAWLDRFEPLYVAAYLVGGLAILALALRRVRSTTALRQLRWIVWGTAIGAGPFLLAYAMPFAFGATPSLAMELTAVPLGLMPLAFASAIVRYRLMDVEGILKRLLVYTAAVSAIAAIYMVIVRTTGVYFVSTEDDHRWVIAALATVVVLLLARPVKDGVQSAIERVFYRDRYDYRRALVGFARELNTDLDLDRLAERLLARVKDTLDGRPAVPDVGHRLRRVRRRFVTPASIRRRRRSPAARRWPPAWPRATSSASTIRWPPPAAGRGSRVLARRRPLLLRAVRLEGRRDRGARRWAGAKTASR